MPGENAPLSSSNVSSSDANEEFVENLEDPEIEEEIEEDIAGNSNGSGGGEEKSIVELSEIIVLEIGSNTSPQSPRGAETIFHVPKDMLRGVDKYSYQPTIFSIGPYHRGENATDDMRRNEQGKLSSLKEFIEDSGLSIRQLTKTIASIQTKARSCYEGDLKMDWNLFCKMLLLDAVLLIGLLQYLGHEQEQEQEQEQSVVQGSDNNVSKDADGQSGAPATSCDDVTQGCETQENTNQGCRHKVAMTLHDLIMLENQIPFFVVKKVYKLRYAEAIAATGNGSAIRVEKLAWGFVKGVMSEIPSASDPSSLVSDADDNKCMHLVHVCHVYLKPTKIADATCRGSGAGADQTDQYQRFRRATEYYGAGVSFRRWDADNNGTRRPLLDMTFSDGVLRMALQTVDEKTGYILRNVLAYEQKNCQSDDRKSYVTAYVIFMSQLMGRPEDVALLARCGIMKHLLGNDEEVCALFRSLVNGLIFNPESEHYLRPVGMGLQRYGLSRFPRWRAWIIRHRFSNPWLVAAWVFGALAVLGTILQTVYAVLEYYRSSKRT